MRCRGALVAGFRKLRRSSHVEYRVGEVCTDSACVDFKHMSPSLNTVTHFLSHISASTRHLERTKHTIQHYTAKPPHHYP